ncbi:MAG TPA: transporter, partial [Candidatus Didemnitutus sp.]|nr:transporter [Candidatus Didemnitutus sp.]
MSGPRQLIIAVLALPLIAAADTAPDKSGYTLFNRTPASQLRELTTDRPDVTESPYTVDAGWWQIEMDLAAFTRDRDTLDGANTKSTSLSVANLNIKVGLTNNIDLQTVVSAYTIERDKDFVAHTSDKVSGYSDLTSRLKINFWGNDDGKTAFGIMPFVKWPTAQHRMGNDKIEGGLIFPLAISLGAGWDMGLTTEFDFVRNVTDTGYRTDWVNTITVGHDIVGSLGGYVELTSTVVQGRDRA